MLRKKKLLAFLLLIVTVAALLTVTALAADGEEAEEYVSNMYGTFWALVPPIIAIVLALITKEVYSSLFIGIVVGALFHANFSPVKALTTMVNDGFIAKLADGWNVGILLFLVILGIIVVLVNKAGGSLAYGNWAIKHIKTRRGAQLATFVLGVIIFIDDYFNCLTVGSVMRPVTDTHNVSRAKLAYLIDATAAPVCMIAPISSWAAAVAGVAGYEGLTLFIKAIPFNFYSLFTFVMIILLIVLGLDFGPMRRHEKNAEEKGDLFTTADRPFADASEEVVSTKGRVYDLVIPVVILIILCVIGMIYTGGFFEGETFMNAFANCDAAVGLALGSLLSLIIIVIYFMCRRVLTFTQCMEAIPAGFKAMVPAILILTFAWTLSAMTGLLGAAEYVAGILDASAGLFQNFLPAIIFIIACILSFATGTSWGTFGILIPIIVKVFEATPESSMLIVCISACLAGAVCGDHCSPISDTTIMSSTGAQCNHVNHVTTQLPYAITVALVAFVTYIIAGFTQSAWISLPCGAAILAIVLLIANSLSKKKAA